MFEHNHNQNYNYIVRNGTFYYCRIIKRLWISQRNDVGRWRFALLLFFSIVEESGGFSTTSYGGKWEIRRDFCRFKFLELLNQNGNTFAISISAALKFYILRKYSLADCGAEWLSIFIRIIWLQYIEIALESNDFFFHFQKLITRTRVRSKLQCFCYCFWDVKNSCIVHGAFCMAYRPLLILYYYEKFAFFLKYENRSFCASTCWFYQPFWFQDFYLLALLLFKLTKIENFVFCSVVLKTFFAVHQNKLFTMFIKIEKRIVVNKSKIIILCTWARTHPSTVRFNFCSVQYDRRRALWWKTRRHKYTAGKSQ